MKRIQMIVTSAVCVMSMFFGVSLASALDHGPEKLTINHQVTNPEIHSKKDKKKVKDFPHKAHQGKNVKGKESVSYFKFTDDWTCGACHHTNKKGEQPTSCLSCKDVNKMLKHKKIKGKVDKMYHTVCRDACHKKTDKKMSKCKFCH